MSDTYTYWFKGDELRNLYRIDGVLIAQSPLHIGTGEWRYDEKELEAWEEKQAKGEATPEDEPAKIDEIERDSNDLPLIPGSALRGVVRHYLLAMFRGFPNSKIAKEEDYESVNFKNEYKDQKAQKEYMQKDASLLEQLFGTPFCESKAEFWDACLTARINGGALSAKGWDNNRQSYVVRSVAIDPETGAAARNKLYSFDVAPAGLQFSVTIVGRNFSEPELGMLLAGLEGFNNPIYPLTLGAMGGRGFGRMKWVCKNIYRLQPGDLPNWLNLAATRDDAGYGLLPDLDQGEATAATLISDFKTAFQHILEGKK